MNLRHLLSCSAAAMMVATGAQAADLPASEPVEYMRVCDAFGTGFFYIPGTDTCLKISGYARYEAHYVDGDVDRLFDDDGNPFSPSSEDAFNNFTTRARGQVNFDARTMTDLGLLRSYVALRGTVGPADFGAYSDGFNVDKAWLSLANDMGTLTAGHHGSFFDFFGGSAMNTRIGGDDQTVTTNTLAYTFAVGNGVTATVAAEDKWFRRYGVQAGIAVTLTNSEGQEIPDFVANIRVDQGWGSAQIMGAVGRVGTSAPLVSDNDIGYAVGAGLSVGVPGTGIGFDVQGTWAEGLVAYATTGNGAPVFDAVATVGNFDLTEAWAIQAALGADLSSNVAVSLNGSYAQIDHSGVFLSGLDHATWTVAGTAHWKPVSGLTISGEIAYERVDTDFSAIDPEVWGAMMRINRTF